WVGAVPGNPGPFRPLTRQKQPRVVTRAIRGLEIVNPIEGAIAQSAAQREPSRNVERPGSAIDGDVVEKSALLPKGSKFGGGKQGNLVGGVVPPDRRRRPERLDKIAKGAELDDKDLAPLRRRNGIYAARPRFRQSPE